jgi:hypothetical protein
VTGLSPVGSARAMGRQGGPKGSGRVRARRDGGKPCPPGAKPQGRRRMPVLRPQNEDVSTERWSPTPVRECDLCPTLLYHALEVTMRELSQIIPDAQVLLAMEPEELGAKILFLLRKRSDHSQQPFLFSNLIGELWPQHYPYLPGQQPPNPREQQNEINLALAEAWAWLVAQGLLVPAPGQHGGPDWRVLSRRARRFEDEAEFARYAVARMLPKEALHPRISNKVWSAFMRSEFDVAAFQAMKAVEVAVREASDLSNDLLGTKLVRKAFDPKWKIRSLATVS